MLGDEISLLPRSGLVNEDKNYLVRSLAFTTSSTSLEKWAIQSPRFWGTSLLRFLIAIKGVKYIETEKASIPNTQLRYIWNVWWLRNHIIWLPRNVKVGHDKHPISNKYRGEPWNPGVNWWKQECLGNTLCRQNGFESSFASSALQ